VIGGTESAPPSINPMTATEVGSGGVAAPAHPRTQSRHRAHVLVYRSFPVLALLMLASFLRLWQLDRVGFNSDEAVYSGTAAAMAGNDTLRTMFPIFRAHPLLLQMLLSVWMKGPGDDFAARAVCAMIGVLTVLATYCLGKRLYGTSAGVVAGLLLAVMPYHVTVSRQVLLDGLMTLFATLVVYCVVRYAESGALRWMLAGGAAMGLTVLSKETSIVLLGALYAFFA
jgi:4-amino-4-deoxy-L-arabinose transferase-like glycosyltransferase